MLEVNHFNMKKQWLVNTPCLFYSLIVGGLSDASCRRKPLLAVPLFGFLVASVLQLLICVFAEALPVQAFYADTFFAFCGGLPVYYIGVYAFGASVTTPEERPHRLLLF